MRRLESYGAQTTKPSLFVVFEKAEEALQVVKAKPSYPTTGNPLADFWVPRLCVEMKSTFDQREREHARTAQPTVPIARAPATQISAPVGSDRAVATRGECNYILKTGCLCVARDVPDGVTWEFIKAKLGNLCLNAPQLRGKLGAVHVEGGKAFIVCKTPAAASCLVLSYNAVMADPHSKFLPGLKATVPSLLCATPEEEAFAFLHYNEWMKKREKKNDAKRGREDESEGA